MALAVKNPPATEKAQETWVRSLSQEDALEVEMATHPSILAWKIPGERSPVVCGLWGHKETQPSAYILMLSAQHVLKAQHHAS